MEVEPRIKDVPVSTSEEMTNPTLILQPFTSTEEKSLPTVPFFDVSIISFYVKNLILSLM